MVSELTIRTAVLNAPQRIDRWALASWKASGARRPVDDVGHEQPAEEHDFGDQEDPHAERRRLVLLLHVVEVMLQLRMVRVVA